MKIEREGGFTPIVITIESIEEAENLLDDLHVAEDFMVNENVEPKRSKLHTNTLALCNIIERMTR